MPAAASQYSQNRCGRPNGFPLPTDRAAHSYRVCCICSRTCCSDLPAASSPGYQIDTPRRQLPRPPGRKPKDHRPAKPPMCDQQRPPFHQPLPAIFTCAVATATPISRVIGSPGILNVNRDGTGSSIVCPNRRIQSNIPDFGYPPHATHT